MSGIILAIDLMALEGDGMRRRHVPLHCQRRPQEVGNLLLLVLLFLLYNFITFGAFTSSMSCIAGRAVCALF